MQDMWVRRAMSLALNREAIAHQIMEGYADPTDQPAPPFIFGALRDRPVPGPDLNAARALLAEAGFPQGFGFNLFCSPSRTPKICQAMAAAWTRIGIRTAVEIVPQATFLTRRNKREYGAFVRALGSLTGETSYLLGSQLHSAGTVPGLGTLNFTGLDTPETDAPIQRARATLDDAARAATAEPDATHPGRAPDHRRWPAALRQCRPGTAELPGASRRGGPGRRGQGTLTRRAGMSGMDPGRQPRQRHNVHRVSGDRQGRSAHGR